MGLNNSLLKIKRDKAPRTGGALFRFSCMMVFMAYLEGGMPCQFFFCCVASRELAKLALHLMFAQNTRRGRLSSPKPPKVERNAGFTGGLCWCIHADI